MAIHEETPSQGFGGNNSTTNSYDIPFRFDDPTWLSVYHEDHDRVRTELQLGTDYIVFGSGTMGQGKVRTNFPIPEIHFLVVDRKTPIEQTVASASPVQSYSSAIEGQLDLLSMSAQDQRLQLDRKSGTSIRTPEGELLPELPGAVDRAGKTLGFNGSGNPILVSTGLITNVDLVVAKANAANASAAAAESSANSASAFAAAATAAASAAQTYSPVLRGPYVDAKAAISDGVPVGQAFFKSDFSAGLARYAAQTVALFGDSILNFSTAYLYGILITDGDGYGVRLNIRASLPNPHLINVTCTKSAGTAGLSWSVVGGTDFTINLATVGGVVTTTVSQLKAYVISVMGDKFLVDDFDLYDSNGNSTNVKMATTVAKTWGIPSYSYNSPKSPLIWIQALLYQRFDLVRRRTQSGFQYRSSTEGDWDFGYPGQRSDDLIRNPGPMGDVLASNADLIIGCSGANDVIQGGATAAIIRDRIVALWDTLAAANRQFIWMEVPPAAPVGRQSLVDAINALLRPVAVARRIVLLPWKPSFVSAGAALPAYFKDGTHPTDLAAYEQGVYSLAAIDAAIQVVKPIYGNPSDGKWITANPGTTGSSSGLATSWVNGNPALISTSKVAATDGGNEWQQCAIADPGGNDLIIYSGNQTTGWAAGDVVEGVAEINCVASGWNMKGFILSTYFLGNSSNPSNSAMLAETYDDSGMTSGNKAFNGVLRTPPVQIPHGTTAVAISIRSFGSGTYKFRNAGLRKSTQQV